MACETMHFLRPTTRFLLAAFILFDGTTVNSQEPSAASSKTLPNTELRAVAFLEKEVPAWRPENKCFSCHNNGDGARALFLASKANLPVASSAFAETTEFLRQPNLWDKNGPDGPFNDRNLARLQFAHALATAVQEGVIQDRHPLIDAAEKLAADQAKSGGWDFSGEDIIGSPVTYGRPLATAIAINVLRYADPERFAKSIGAAEAWIGKLEPASVLNSAAVVIGLQGCKTPAADLQRSKALAIIRQGQTRDGGWGPYLNSAPEPFDTAVVLLALADQDRSQWGKAIESGRQFLRLSQLPNGSWPETTRPAGGESYAQWIATTAWATIALIKSR